MDAERDTDGTTDAHEGDHTPADGAGTEGEGGKPDTRPGDKLAIIRRNPGLSVFTHAATLTAIVVLYNWFGQTYLLSRLSLAYILYFFPGLLITPMTALLVTAFLHDRLSWKKIICIIVLSYCLTILGVFSERVVVLAERRSTRRFAEYLAFYRSANTGDYLLWIAGMAHHHLWDWAGAPQPDQTKHQSLMMNVSIFQEQGS